MKRILVIEDEALLLEGIIELLSAEGYDAIAATNGQEGIQTTQKLLPDLILCDVSMPVLNGYETLQSLRCNPQTALIPFIFLTARGTAADFRQGLRLGADDYLMKPFNRQELLEAIETHLRKLAMASNLQQSNLLKGDLLSTISHEIRSPLTNMLSTIKVLRTIPSTNQQQHYLEVLQAQCSHEITMLNRLLDLQRLEAKVDQPWLEMLNLYMWVPAIAEPFEIRACDRQQILQVDLEADLPLFRSDCTNLKRILSELLHNACKYTPIGGKISLNVQSKQSSAFIYFTVRNEAEIPAVDLPYIFEKFYRVANVDFHQQGGSGLGLPLVQKLVEQLEGTLYAESENGWTTFTARLPT
jgi:two-component system, sensor histidine kinase and response regulator